MRIQRVETWSRTRRSRSTTQSDTSLFQALARDEEALEIVFAILFDLAPLDPHGADVEELPTIPVGTSSMRAGDASFLFWRAADMRLGILGHLPL